MTTERGNRLSNKVAIVTGAGATGSGDFVGIGQAISILFARQGAKVLLVDREERNAETTLAMIREEGGEASIFAGDVTSNDDTREMAEAAKSRFGNVNVLINNVGISGPGSVTDVDVDFWDVAESRPEGPALASHADSALEPGVHVPRVRTPDVLE